MPHFREALLDRIIHQGGRQENCKPPSISSQPLNSAMNFISWTDHSTLTDTGTDVCLKFEQNLAEHGSIFWRIATWEPLAPAEESAR